MSSIAAFPQDSKYIPGKAKETPAKRINPIIILTNFFMNKIMFGILKTFSSTVTFKKEKKVVFS